MKTSRGFVVEQLLAHGEDCSGTLCILIQQRSVGDRKKLSPTLARLLYRMLKFGKAYVETGQQAYEKLCGLRR